MIRVNRFDWQANDVEYPQCFYCTRLLKDQTCEAFPEGIPQKILDNKVLHTVPFPGDNGILFELKPGMKKLYLEFLETI